MRFVIAFVFLPVNEVLMIVGVYKMS